MSSCWRLRREWPASQRLKESFTLYSFLCNLITRSRTAHTRSIISMFSMANFHLHALLKWLHVIAEMLDLVDLYEQYGTHSIYNINAKVHIPTSASSMYTYVRRKKSFLGRSSVCVCTRAMVIWIGKKYTVCVIVKSAFQIHDCVFEVVGRQGVKNWGGYNKQQINISCRFLAQTQKTAICAENASWWTWTQIWH